MGCLHVSMKLTTRYCVFVESNLVSWKSKKQCTVSRSSVGSKYRAMTDLSCQNDVGKGVRSKHKWLDWYCDQSSVHIAKNQVFHERIKRIKVDCRIRYCVVGTLTHHSSIQPIKRTEYHLAGILTMSFRKTQIDFICNNYPICSNVRSVKDIAHIC